MTDAEVIWLIRQEHVRHLADIILRRTTLAISGLLDSNLLDAIASIASRELGWSHERARHEREEVLDELETYHGVTPTMLEARCREKVA